MEWWCRADCDPGESYYNPHYSENVDNPETYYIDCPCCNCLVKVMCSKVCSDYWEWDESLKDKHD